MSTLLYDAEPKVRHPEALDHPRAFQLDLLVAQVVEEPDALSEKDGHQLYPYLVDQPGLDALLRDVRAANADVLAARGRSRRRP
jgi:hypothetical protein